MAERAPALLYFAGLLLVTAQARTTAQPMDIGIKMTNPHGVTREGYYDLVKQADRLGYHSVWIGERWAWDMYVTLTHLADITERIQLGASIVNVFSRTPGAIAQASASLDHLSNGRLILGLGVSGRMVVERWHGTPFHKPVQRTREYVEVLRQMLGGWRVDYDGELVQSHGFTLEVPLVRDNIPIYIASLGPKNVAMTAEVADGWLPVYISPDRTLEAVREFHQAAQAAGKEPKSLVMAPEIYAGVTDDAEGVRRMVRKSLSRSLMGRGAFYADQVRRAGFDEDMDTLTDLWDQGKREQAPAALSDELIDAVSVIGSADECREKLAWLHGLGWDLPIVRFPRGASENLVVATLKGLAPR